MSIIQQLEDLKEWSKDSTRYERRLAFRRGYPRFPMGTEAGTIPIEWDELSDREREYYRTGPWSTREDYSKGQLVQPGPGRQGYNGKKKIPHSSAKDKVVLSKDIIAKIKKRIKLPVGQKWNFYDPKINPEGYTYGVRKAKYPNLWDTARNVGKEGRAESKLAQATETYKKIKANPKLLAEKQLYDRELYMGKREQVLEEAQIKYASDKEFREAKLEYEKIQRIENPEKFKKKNSDWFAKRGSFPPGNNYKEHVWRDMFRSSQKSGQERFLLVDEKGKFLTPDNFPKVNGKVRWDVDGAYKKVKFFDQETGQYVKFSDDIKGKKGDISFEKYLDQKSVGGKGAFKNAVEGYKLKDDYKNLSWKNAKGEDIRLGTFMQDKLKTKSDFVKSGINVQHSDLDNAFWKNEVSTATSNMELKKLESEVLRKLRAANKIEDVKLKNITKNKALNVFKTEIERLPGGITKVIEGTTYGIKPTAKSVISAAGKEFGATRYKNFKAFKNALYKQFPEIVKQCGLQKAEGGRIGFASGTQSFDDCMRGAIADETRVAKGFGANAKKAMQRLGGVAKWAGKWIGLIDVPIEFAFALPALLRGDIEGAKRHTTFGLLGWGETQMEQMKETNPEAYKFLKHDNDIMNWQQAEWQLEHLNEAKERLEKMNVSGYGTNELNQINTQIEELLAKQTNIEENYIGYEYTDEVALGKQMLGSYVKNEADRHRERVEQEGVFRGNVPIVDDAFGELTPTSTMPEKERKAVDYPDTYGGYLMKKQFDKTEGRYREDPIIEALIEEGPYMEVDEWRKRYMPKVFGDSPGYLNARFGRKEIEDYNRAVQSAQGSPGFNYAGFAGGGIAGIRRPWAIPPESGPMPQGGGLSSQYNRVKKLTG